VEGFGRLAFLFSSIVPLLFAICLYKKVPLKATQIINTKLRKRCN